jgi:hypothetical protein
MLLHSKDEPALLLQHSMHFIVAYVEPIMLSLGIVHDVVIMTRSMLRAN